jgi:hypothetical protein
MPRRHRSPLVAHTSPVSTVQFFRSGENARPTSDFVIRPVYSSIVSVGCLV